MISPIVITEKLKTINQMIDLNILSSELFDLLYI